MDMRFIYGGERPTPKLESICAYCGDKVPNMSKHFQDCWVVRKERTQGFLTEDGKWLKLPIPDGSVLSEVVSELT